MKRESFVFYRSFYEGMKCLPDDQKLVLYAAIMEKALNGKDVKDMLENSGKEVGAVTMGLYALIEPQLLANNRKYESGKKGGRPKKNNKQPITEKPEDIPVEKPKDDLDDMPF